MDEPDSDEDDKPKSDIQAPVAPRKQVQDVKGDIERELHRLLKERAGK